MTKLSVNINKIATLRNARGGDNPNVVQVAKDCERFGAQGITVHPRPDQRHIRYSDVTDLKGVILTEMNIEGNPIDKFIDLVLRTKPVQVTLVPDGDDQLTSNHGWNTVTHQAFLTDVVKTFKEAGIRTSIFVDPEPVFVEHAARTGADRVELYTEPYASAFPNHPEQAVAPYIASARVARECGLGLNAGHDLSLINLKYYIEQIPWTDEVSIGHALICNALYLGLEETIKRYRKCLE